MGRRGPLSDDSAPIENDYPVRERADLLQFQRDEQYRLALGALLQDLAVDELYGPHVHAAGGLGYQDPGRRRAPAPERLSAGCRRRERRPWRRVGGRTS